MRNRFAAMRRLIAVSAIMTVPVMAVGCNTCNTAAKATCARPVAVKPAPSCSAPVIVTQPVVYQAAPAPAAVMPAYRSGPVCDGSVALDGSVIQNGQIVFDGAAAARAAHGAPYAPLYATTYMDYYTAQQAAPAKTAVVARKSAPAKKSALPGGTGEAVRVGKPVKERAKLIKPAARPAPKAVAAPAPAPVVAAPVVARPVVVQPETTLVPNAIGAQDVTALATVSDVYTLTPDQTYTVMPAQTPAAVVSPVVISAPQPAPIYQQGAAAASAESIRVLGPSTMGLTSAELDNYSKVDVYEAPPQPAPVPPPVIPGAGTCAPEVVQQGLCPNPF